MEGNGDLLMLGLALLAFGIAGGILLPPEFWNMSWVGAAWEIVARAWR